MKLGAFSVSQVSKTLLLPRHFTRIWDSLPSPGASSNTAFIMKNGNALIGLFQGMFEGNILTFNPGWDENAGP